MNRTGELGFSPLIKNPIYLLLPKIHMKLTNYEVFTIYPALGQLLEKDLPISSAYSLAKIVKDLDNQYKIIEDLRIALAKKMGKEEDGKLVVPNEKMEEFTQELDKVFSQEEDFDFEKISIQVENVKTKDIIVLDKLIEFKSVD